MHNAETSKVTRDKIQCLSQRHHLTYHVQVTCEELKGGLLGTHLNWKYSMSFVGAC